MGGTRAGMCGVWGLASCLLIGGGAGWADEVDHDLWDELLDHHVHDGLVDYRGLINARAKLTQYLDQLAAVEVDRLAPNEERLAFWINLYNACVVDKVLDHYPLESVKRIPGFFTTPHCRAGGEHLTIDQVGARGHAVGGVTIHFAIVCASLGCPALRDDAYEAKRLARQLDSQARAYCADPVRGVRVDAETATVWVTKIVHWHRADFRQPAGWLGLHPPLDLPRLVEALEPYLKPEVVAQLRQGGWRVRVIKYDWALNEANGN